MESDVITGGCCKWQRTLAPIAGRMLGEVGRRMRGLEQAKVCEGASTCRGFKSKGNHFFLCQSSNVSSVNGGQSVACSVNAAQSSRGDE